MKKVLAVSVLLAVAAVATANTWVEQGDAPELLPGQQTVGSAPLDMITGVLGASDTDLYCIRIVDEALFSATTTGYSTLDTQLWLFDENGNGVTFNDDNPAGGLQSALSSTFVTYNGLYYIGISQYNRDALNPAGALIWNSSPFNVERAPDGPGAPGPLASWVNTTSTTGAYGIALTGADFCVPEPASFVLLALTGLLRRR